jgi:LacI family transcriptional regulator
VSRPVTLRDVARVADVSPKTVSRVVNGDAHVTPSTRERVQQAIDDLGFEPNLVARSLRVGRADAIGLVVESLADPFFARLTSAVEQAALEHGLAVMISSVGDLPEREAVVVRSLLVRQVAGLIVVPVAQTSAHLEESRQRTPIVFVDRRPDGVDGDAVVVDDLAAAETATRHLLDHGHRRVAFLGSQTRNPTTRLRLEGYRRALAAYGLAENPALVALGAGTARAAREAAELLFAGPQPPTAVFASNMRCSLGLVPFLHSSGRTGVAVVGFDDFPMADSLVPAVTVIDHEPEAVGRAAAEQLFRRLADPDAPAETVVVPVHLVQRGSGELPPTAGSTGPAAASGGEDDPGRRPDAPGGRTDREREMPQEGGGRS